MTNKQDLQHNKAIAKAIFLAFKLQVLSFAFLETVSFALYHQSFAKAWFVKSFEKCRSKLMSPYVGIIFRVYTKFSANRNKLFCPVLNEVDLFAADNSTVELRYQLKRMSWLSKTHDFSRVFEVIYVYWRDCSADENQLWKFNFFSLIKLILKILFD
jgi:hypothetical protein